MVVPILSEHGLKKFVSGFKMGTNFFRSDSDIRKSNVTKEHEWPRFYSAGMSSNGSKGEVFLITVFPRIVSSLEYFPPLNSFCSQTLIQGQSWQTVFFKLALRDRNMQVSCFWKVVLKSWGLRNFGTTTSFHEMYTVCHLQSNL